jgi:putative transcriptional regulator
MTIKFHVSNDILVSYSAGTLDEASSLLVATHLALCPHCRARNRSADSLGGYLLDSLEEAPVSSAMKDTVLSRVRSESPVSVSEAESRPRKTRDAVIPDPLRSYVGGDLDELHWRRLAPRVQQIAVPTANGRSKARLLRFQSGLTVPSHGHNGRELTLVLTGSLCDRDSILYRGNR